jgi:hypothetical protein
MFSSGRNRRQAESFSSKHRAGKSTSKKNSSFRDSMTTKKVERMAQQASPASVQTSPTVGR